jgi:transcriptional regulator with XRE-family HTH domain
VGDVDGVALARARAELGISRDQLSSYSGVSRETLRKIEELGYVPKAGTVRKIEEGLHKAAEELSVTQRLAALERQIDVLQSVVQALIVARIAQQDDFPVEK